MLPRWKRSSKTNRLAARDSLVHCAAMSFELKLSVQCRLRYSNHHLSLDQPSVNTISITTPCPCMTPKPPFACPTYSQCAKIEAIDEKNKNKETNRNAAATSILARHCT
jgi:hypothetical protein